MPPFPLKKKPCKIVDIDGQAGAIPADANAGHIDKHCIIFIYLCLSGERLRLSEGLNWSSGSLEWEDVG